MATNISKEPELANASHKQPSVVDRSSSLSGSGNGVHGVPELVNGGANETRMGKKEWFAYIKTKQFWVVLLLGCVIRGLNFEPSGI